MFFFIISLAAIFFSGVTWKESRLAWLFILAFITLFSALPFLTGRGGMELYKTEHILQRYQASFTLFGWRPTLIITAERIMFAISMFARVFTIASMTILIPYSLNPSLYGVTFRRLGLPDKIAPR